VEFDATGVGYDHTSGCSERMVGRGPQIEDILHAQSGRGDICLLLYLLAVSEANDSLFCFR